jgi:hypothetical protein
MNELDETLDSMSPEELRALESEIDKKASETTVAYYLGLGARAAREQYAEFKKTGTMSPALFLVKAAADKTRKDAEFSDALDKCSAEELAEIEADLDARILSKISEEIAGSYYEQGEKLAHVLWPTMQKEAMKVPAMGLRAAKKVVKPAQQLAARTGVTTRQVLQAPAKSGMPAASAGFGTQVGQFIERHPLATGLAAGAVGMKLLSDR